MNQITDLTQLCVYGVSTGFLLSMVMWFFGVLPRAFRLFVR